MIQSVPLLKIIPTEEAKKMKFSIEIQKLLNVKSKYSQKEFQEGCYIRFESNEKVTNFLYYYYSFLCVIIFMISF